jgi:hypothetical protein
LWKALVPDSGQAETVQGELIRCIGCLGSERYRNGNANWDEGFVLMAQYLAKHLGDGTFDVKTTRLIEQDVEAVIEAGKNPENGAYVHESADAYDRLTDRVVEWCRVHHRPMEHTKDDRLKR